MEVYRNTVVVADAIALLKELPDNSIPLIVTDPPFGIGYHSGHYKGKNPHAPITGDWNFQIGAFLMECFRVLRDGGALYLFSRWDVYPEWMPFLAASGLKLKTKIVWVKNNWSAGDLKGAFGSQYEEILFLTKGRHILRGKRYSNVWQFDRVPARAMLHPTQKPVPLLERAILASSDPGDLVLDPFAGSGSTGVAARNTGRDFLLGDVDVRMVNIARKRLGLELLPVEDVRAEEVPPYRFSLPDPAEWGIHPEELRFLLDELRDNLDRLDGQP